MTNLRFASEKDFNDYTFKVSKEINNLPLRVLRTSMAKAEGYNHISVYIKKLNDGNEVSQPKSKPMAFNPNIYLRWDGKILDLSGITHIDPNVMLGGIVDWNDSMESALTGSYGLQDIQWEHRVGEVKVSGFIDTADIRDDSHMKNIITHFIANQDEKWEGMAVFNAVMNDVEKQIEKFGGWANFQANFGGDLPEQELPFDLDDLKLPFDVMGVRLGIPKGLIYEKDREANAEFQGNVDMSLNDIISIATNDAYESLVSYMLGRAANAQQAQVTDCTCMFPCCGAKQQCPSAPSSMLKIKESLLMDFFMWGHGNNY